MEKLLEAAENVFVATPPVVYDRKRFWYIVEMIKDDKGFAAKASMVCPEMTGNNDPLESYRNGQSVEVFVYRRNTKSQLVTAVKGRIKIGYMLFDAFIERKRDNGLTLLDQLTQIEQERRQYA